MFERTHPADVPESSENTRRPLPARPGRRVRAGLSLGPTVKIYRRQLMHVLVVAAVAGLATVGAVAATGRNQPPVDSPLDFPVGADAPTDPTGFSQTNQAAASPPTPTVTGDSDGRVVAVDRSAVGVPAQVGDRVELLGLKPTVDSVESVVITNDAVVVGGDDRMLLLMPTRPRGRVLRHRASGGRQFGCTRPRLTAGGGPRLIGSRQHHVVDDHRRCRRAAGKMFHVVTHSSDVKHHPLQRRGKGAFADRFGQYPVPDHSSGGAHGGNRPIWH